MLRTGTQPSNILLPNVSILKTTRISFNVKLSQMCLVIYLFIHSDRFKQIDCLLRQMVLTFFFLFSNNIKQVD